MPVHQDVQVTELSEGNAAVSQKIQNVIDGQTGPPNDRLSYHDFRIQDNSLDQFFIFHKATPSDRIIAKSDVK